MTLPSGIAGINYDLINKYEQILIKCNKYTIIDLPKNIPGINYNLINEYNKLSNSNSIDVKIIRIEPPYTIPCEYSKSNNCQKTAAFKDINKNECYCWFHAHCNC